MQQDLKKIRPGMATLKVTEVPVQMQTTSSNVLCNTETSAFEQILRMAQEILKQDQIYSKKFLNFFLGVIRKRKSLRWMKQQCASCSKEHYVPTDNYFLENNQQECTSAYCLFLRMKASNYPLNFPPTATLPLLIFVKVENIGFSQ